MATRATLKAANAVASAQSLRSLGSLWTSTTTTTYISWLRPGETKHLDSDAEPDSGCPVASFCVFRDFCFGFSLCVAKAGFSYAQRPVRARPAYAMLLGQLPVGTGMHVASDDDKVVFFLLFSAHLHKIKLVSVYKASNVFIVY